MNVAKNDIDWDRKKQYFFFYPPIATLENITEDSIWDTNMSLYFHIPFCKKKCHYCYYVSLSGNKISTDLIESYLEVLKAELHIYSNLLNRKNITITSVYFGGGTPTLLETSQLSELLKIIREKFKLSEDPEITIDSCPKTLTDDKIEELKCEGIKRICMGIQTFDDDILKNMNRNYSGYEAADRLNAMKRIGIDYRVIDLMYGLPGQDFNKAEKDLQTVQELMPEGLSFYRLSIRPETRLYQRKKQGNLFKMPSEEENIFINEHYLDFLSNAGYNQVASPSFALPTRDFLHQKNYWSGGDYIGLGVSSFSYYNNSVFINTRSIKDYINKLLHDNTLPLDIGKKITAKERLHREVCLRTKLLEINPEEISSKYGFNIERYFYHELETLTEEGLIFKNDKKYQFTRLGSIYNDNISRLFYSDNIRDYLDNIDSEQNLMKNLI